MSALLTASELAMRRSDTALHPIPPITDLLGKHWTQPSRLDIEIDETHAMIPRAAFVQLADYTQSQPTGVYPGKMWKAMSVRQEIACPACKALMQFLHIGWVPNRLWIACYCKLCQCQWTEMPAWYLRWFGAEFTHPQDGKCVSNHKRQILIV